MLVAATSAGAVAVTAVVPVLNEAENLPELYRRLTTVLTDLHADFEIVLVDDGSTDDSAVMLKELAQRDARVRVLRLDGNYGQHAAVMAGLRHARGAFVVTLDADMQTPPDEIPLLLAKLNDGFDVVFGVFRQSRHPPLQRLLSRMGHAAIEPILGLPQDVSFSPFRALTRSLVDRLTDSTDNPVQLETLLCRCARRMGAVDVRHEPRRAGETKYTWRRRVRFVWNLLRGLREPGHRRDASRPQYVVAECIGPVDDCDTEPQATDRGAGGFCT